MQSERIFTDSDRVLIVGAGFMGGRLAASLRREPIAGLTPENIVCTTRSEDNAARLVAQGWAAHAVDLGSSTSLESLVDGARAVVFCAAPSGSSSRDQVYAQGPAKLAAALPAGAQFVLASSTGVYAEADGGVVDEESALSDSDRAAAMLQGEASAVGASGTVLRFSGLMGPERGPHRRSLSAGVQLDRWLNLVWIEDIVAALRWAIREQPAGVFNVSGPAQRRREFYDAIQLGRGLALLSWAADEREGYRVDSSKWERASGITARRVSASLLLAAG